MSRQGGGLPLAAGLGSLALVAAGLAGVIVLAGATFVDPEWLWLATGAPVLLVVDALARARRRGLARRLGDPAAIDRLVEHGTPGVRATRAVLGAWAVLCLAVACARPQWGHVEEEVKRRGVDVLVCVDTSKSMLAEDVRPSRMARARLELASLVDRLPGDRIGLIAFAGEARVLCPLTLDHGAVKLFLDLLDPNVVDRPGTAIGPALELAAKSFPKQSARHAVVVLITDGEDHEGGVLEAAEDLAAAGIVVHAVGIGKPEGGPIPVEQEDAAGHRGVSYLRDEKGSAVMSRLDVETLRSLAKATSGTFHQATSSELELTAIAAAIARMEQQEFGSRTSRVRPDRAGAFLAAAFALLALETFLPDGGPLLPRRRVARTLRAAAWLPGRRGAEREAA